MEKTQVFISQVTHLSESFFLSVVRVSALKFINHFFSLNIEKKIMKTLPFMI